MSEIGKSDMSERLDRIERILEAVAAQPQVNTQAIENNTRSIDRVTTDIEGLALQMEQMLRSAEQDRAQAAIDRAEFRSTVQVILDTWTQRFGGNGHSREE